MQTPNERTVHCNWSQSKPWGNMDNRIFDKFERNFTNYTGVLTCSSYDTVLDGIIRPCIIRPPFRPSTISERACYCPGSCRQCREKENGPYVPGSDPGPPLLQQCLDSPYLDVTPS